MGTLENILPQGSVDVAIHDVLNTQTKKDENELKSTTEVKTVEEEMEETKLILSFDDFVSQLSYNDEEEVEKEESEFPTTAEETGSTHEVLKPLTEVEDDAADEKDPFKPDEIVLSPECLQLARFPLSQTLPNPPRQRLNRNRKRSMGDKIFQTVKRKFSSPGKNDDVSAGKKKEKMRIILY